MSNCPFCNLDPAPSASEPNPVDASHPPGLFRRAWRKLQWLFPAALLVLMPKCPLCVAAYIALFTGIGVSVSTARWIQILLLAICLMSLAYFALRYRREARRGRESSATKF
jgi:hypothetical protein